MRARRRLMLRGVMTRGILGSLAIHLVIVGLVIVFGRPEQLVQRQGEPLIIELPNLPEPAPRGNPAEPERVVTPPAPSPPTPARASTPRPAAPPVPVPPRVASAPRPEPAAPAPAAPKAEPTRLEPPVPIAKPEPAPPPPEPRVVTPPRPEPTPAPMATPPPPPPVPEPRVATPAPAPPAKPEPPRETPSPPPVREQPAPAPPRVAAAPASPAPLAPAGPASRGPSAPPVSITGEITPSARAPVPRPAPDTSSMQVARAGEERAGSGGGGASAARATPPSDKLAMLRPRQPGGGLEGGRGGIEGQPVPLDTRDPRYNDYFEQLRRQIQEKWIYPPEAGHRNIGGSLLIEFGIRRDGKLQFIELVSPAPMKVLDDSALIAVKLASPFPPVPPGLLQGTGLPVLVRFNYIVETAGSLNRYKFLH